MFEKHSTLILIGAGGHAKVCYEIAQTMRLWKEIKILDDNPINSFFTIEGPVSEYVKYLDQADYFVAIGSNEVRARFIRDLQKSKCNLITLVHPSSIISPSVQVSSGTVIMPGVIVNASSKIGNGVILNTGSTIDHDNMISDFVHVSPGVHLSGNVQIGKFTWIGIGSSVIQSIRIGDHVIVGARSVVINNVKSSQKVINVSNRETN